MCRAWDAACRADSWPPNRSITLEWALHTVHIWKQTSAPHCSQQKLPLQLQAFKHNREAALRKNIVICSNELCLLCTKWSFNRPLLRKMPREKSFVFIQMYSLSLQSSLLFHLLLFVPSSVISVSIFRVSLDPPDREYRGGSRIHQLIISSLLVLPELGSTFTAVHKTHY